MHIDTRLHYIPHSVKTIVILMMHVDSEWHHADLLTKLLPVMLLKEHRRASMNMGDSI
ncbi:unnamed protein product [Sphacelaria rigidula]